MFSVWLADETEIELPLTVDDIETPKWFSMSAHEREFERMGDKVEPVDFIHHISSAVRSVLEIPEAVPFGLALKTIKNKAWELTPCCFFKIEKEEVVCLPVTVLNVYRHLLWVTRNAQPCEFPVEFDDRLWGMTPHIQKLAEPGEFTAQETVEVLRLEQMFEAELTEARKGADGVVDFSAIAAADYGLSMVQMALLFRPLDEDGKIEPLPHGEAAIEKYVNERVAELQSLPYSIVLSVRFFFLLSLSGVSLMSALEATLAAQSSTPHSG